MRARELVATGVVAVAGIAGSAVALAHRGGDAGFLDDLRHPPSLRPLDVQAVVRSAPDPRTGKGSGVSATCSRGHDTELGNPWSCTVTYRDGKRIRLTVRVSHDGTYAARYQGGGAATGCCIDVPGAQ